MDIAWVEDQQEFEQSPNAKIAVQYAVAYQYEHREEADHHGVVIPDEFCEGSFCSRPYEEIAKRKKKICEKLQVDEDLDLEHIINCMEDFTRYMSMKMYEYGALMGTNPRFGLTVKNYMKFFMRWRFRNNFSRELKIIML